MGNTLLIILCSILMLTGLLGIVLPFIPGVPLVWLSLFIYAIIDGFDQISVTAVILLFFLSALTLLLDFIAPILGVKKYKASWFGVLGSTIGFILGIIFLGFWGIIIGPVIGAFLGELLAKRRIKQSFQAALGSILGSLVGTLLKIVVSLVIIGYFIFSFF